MSDCVFCKIISKEIPSEKVYESDNVLAFMDINPCAPVHVLVVPKQHISGIDTLAESDIPIASELLFAVKKIACDLDLDNGYRVISNVGEDGGQTVRHLHFHIIGGKKLDVRMA